MKPIANGNSFFFSDIPPTTSKRGTGWPLWSWTAKGKDGAGQGPSCFIDQALGASLRAVSSLTLERDLAGSFVISNCVRILGDEMVKKSFKQDHFLLLRCH